MRISLKSIPVSFEAVKIYVIQGKRMSNTWITDLSRHNYAGIRKDNKSHNSAGFKNGCKKPYKYAYLL
jgi:hypothetical protein